MLPIDKYLTEIFRQLSRNSNLILQAEPGAGKSTKVPLSLLNAAFLRGRKIIMLEPRRMAAKSIAYYLAEQLGEQVGGRIGYQIRHERRVSSHTVLEVITEGILTRRLQTDPELNDIALIIFDEFHERSLHADLALMLAVEIQSAYRDDLKLLVMSATIDTALLSNYLSNASVINCPGRMFPVSISYQSRSNNNLEIDVFTAIDSVLRNNAVGDILVFLPGQAEIKRCLQQANGRFEDDLLFLPLYGALPLSQQERVLTKSTDKSTDNSRRIIFSTNIAETSLTIAGITAVIDSGLEKTLQFDVKSGLSRLQTSYISKASATQRAGRAGRLQAGSCIRLWPESKQAGLPEFQPEEIAIADLSSLVLELSSWGINQYEEVNWLTSPPKHHFDVACELNQALGFMDPFNKVTVYGQQAVKLGLHPRLASLLIYSSTQQEKYISCLLAALLSERDILVNVTSSDLVERVLLLAEHLANKNGHAKDIQFNRVALTQVVQLAQSFYQLVKLPINTTLLSLADIQHHVAGLLLTAFPERLAKVRKINGSRYLLANGREVSLKESDSLHGQAWLVVCDCDGQNKGGIIYTCVGISIEQIKTILKDQIVAKTYYALDANKEKIIGKQQYIYKHVVIEEHSVARISSVEFGASVVDIVRSEGLRFLNWTENCQAWLARVQWLGQEVDNFPCINEANLLATLELWLQPALTNIKTIKTIKTIKQLKQLPIYDLVSGCLTWQQRQLLAKDAPEHYITPSGKRVLIHYSEIQAPTVSVVLQEMFGELVSPLLANNKVPLRFELLSPAKRPIQTTSDLANFWRSSYFAVAKDMRGQYPKHRWPSEPLLEKPGRSIKPKG